MAARWPSTRAARGGGGVDWRFSDASGAEPFDAFLRGLTGGAVKASQPTKAAAFASDGTTAYWIDDTFALKADDAVAYGRLPRNWLIVRPPC
jgi:hypothetical protein